MFGRRAKLLCDDIAPKTYSADILNELNQTNVVKLILAATGYFPAVEHDATLTKILSLGFTAPSKPQDESKAHYYDKQQLHELTINWNTMDADAVIALMNACNPHNKGAATKINNKIVRFIAAEKQEDEAAVPCLPGTITAIFDEESIEAALINGGILKINFLHIEEGFITPATLLKMGLVKGMRFEIFIPEKILP